MDHPPLAAEVEQAEEEDRRQRDPDVGGVQLVAELVRVAARHLPGDLITGPGLGDRSRWRRRRSPGRARPRPRRSPPATSPAWPWRSRPGDPYRSLLGGDLAGRCGRSDRPRLGEAVIGRVGGRRRAVRVETASRPGSDPAAGVPCARAAPGRPIRARPPPPRSGAPTEGARSALVHPEGPQLVAEEVERHRRGHRERLGGQLGAERRRRAATGGRG